jgi:aconitate hydratase
MDIDLTSEPLGNDLEGKPVYLRDLWPSPQEVQQQIASSVNPEMFRATYSDVFTGDARWRALGAEPSDLFDWDGNSTYVRRPPYFTDMGVEPDPVADIRGARVLALLGDSVTTDHISPAGSIKADSPAGRYLVEHCIQPAEFNSYGSRRGNHEVMMRGTFANVRLRNRLAPGTEGGWARHLPSGEQMSIYDAAMKYQQENVPLLVLAGKEYGSGSSRDWAAKGPRLLGVRAVIAESYERIHRSNLVGMGVLPLEFPAGQSAESLGLTGAEIFDVTGLGDGSAKEVTVTATPSGGSPISFKARVRIDTPQEVLYYQHGGILQYVLRQMIRQN